MWISIAEDTIASNYSIILMKSGVNVGFTEIWSIVIRAKRAFMCEINFKKCMVYHILMCSTLPLFFHEPMFNC